MYYEYHYKKSVVEISKDGYFTGFTIADKGYSFCYLNNCFKTGDSVSVLSKYFPASYHGYIEEYENLPDEKIRYFRIRIGETDEHIIIKCIKNIITGIATWNEL